MKALVACEESRRVCAAFRKRGHEAYSCDLLPCTGGHQEWHIQDDVRKHARKREWDIILAFPPCTHLSVSGAKYFEEKRRSGVQREAVDFFLFFTTLPARKTVIENPVGVMSGFYRKPDQIINPYQFGENASKKTCLWLKGLPLLKPTKMIPPYITQTGKERWANQRESGRNIEAPGAGRSIYRSKTFVGIAEAMAAQWGGNAGNVMMEAHSAPYIGNRVDALALLDELLEEPTLEQAVKEALEALRDALEREIV
jgi:hypothetical protein